MFLTCKMTKSQPTSSKNKKLETNTIHFQPLAKTAIRKVTLRIPSSKNKESTINTTDIPSPTSTEENLAKNSHSPTYNEENIPPKLLQSFPTPGTVYPPGALLQLDFSFYNTISLRGFTSVLDVMCASTSCPRAYPTRSKRSPTSIVLWLI